MSSVLLSMPLFTYIFTDLTSFDSPSKEVWVDTEDLSEFAARVAREIVEAVPDLTNKGMCLAIYDEAGDAISFVPLDTLH